MRPVTLPTVCAAPLVPARIVVALIVLAPLVAVTALAQTPAKPATPTPAATATPPSSPSASAPAAGAQPVSRPLSCDLAEYRQFDFWIGEWDVSQPDGTFVGTNRITLILGTCVLLENWKGKSGMEGWSFNNYDRVEKKWHQNWVDSRGSRLDLVGSLVGRNMVLVGEKVEDDGSHTLNRITWEPTDHDHVRQLWEQSKDGGKTWAVAFDGAYVRRAGGGSSTASPTHRGGR